MGREKKLQWEHNILVNLKMDKKHMESLKKKMEPMKDHLKTTWNKEWEVSFLQKEKMQGKLSKLISKWIK